MGLTAKVALGVAVVLGVLLAVLATSETQRTGQVNFEILGEVAPPIEGATLDGSQYSLLDERGAVSYTHLTLPTICSV